MSTKAKQTLFVKNLSQTEQKQCCMDMKVAYHTGVLWALSRVSSAGNVRKDARDEAPTSRWEARSKATVSGSLKCRLSPPPNPWGGGNGAHSQRLLLAIFKKSPKNLVKK